MDKTKERYAYWWYHHMAIDTNFSKDINNFLERHDKDGWETFLKLKNELESQSVLEYFPMYCLNLNTNRLVKLTKKRFMHITSAECECG